MVLYAVPTHSQTILAFHNRFINVETFRNVLQFCYVNIFSAGGFHAKTCLKGLKGCHYCRQ